MNETNRTFSCLDELFASPGLSDLCLFEDARGTSTLRVRADGRWIAAVLPANEQQELVDYLWEQNDGDSAMIWRGRRLRLNGAPCLFGYEFVLRLFPSAIPNPNQLLLPETLCPWFLKQHHGIFLLSGATGSGKSTSIAALITQILKTSERRVLTFEDPIEYLFDQGLSLRGICRQRELKTHFDDFPSALRGALRQSPDVIMIQEIRDAETAGVALSAALSGHLVIASIHGSCVREAVQRMGYLLNQSADWEAFVSCLNGVLCQGLIPLNGPRLSPLGGKRAPLFSLLINDLSSAHVLRTRAWNQIDQILELGGSSGMVSFAKSREALRSQGYLKGEML
jgi:twitching motility protein PilT